MEPKTVEEDLASLKEEDLREPSHMPKVITRAILLLVVLLFIGWTVYIALIFAF